MSQVNFSIESHISKTDFKKIKHKRLFSAQQPVNTLKNLITNIQKPQSAFGKTAHPKDSTTNEEQPTVDITAQLSQQLGLQHIPCSLEKEAQSDSHTPTTVTCPLSTCSG